MGTSPRIFYASPHPEFCEHLRQTLARAGAEFELHAATDARQIKSVLQGGAIDIIIFHERLQNPGPDQLATALKRAAPNASFLLMTDRPRRLDESSPFDGAFKYPIGPPVLADTLKRAMRSTQSKDTRGLEAEVMIRYSRLAKQNYYEILGVPENASTDRITKAYDHLSLTFHPDRLREHKGTETERKGMELYLKIGEAYRALRNRSARRRYDAALHGGDEMGSPEDFSRVGTHMTTPKTLDELSRNPTAKKALATAQRALVAKDYQMALVQLNFAGQMDPDNPLIAEKIEQVKNLASS